MTVYVDDMRRRATVTRNRPMVWSHLFADDAEELREFASRLGLRVEWVQHEGTHREHYDVTDTVRRRALDLGAEPITYPWGVADLLDRKKAEAAAWVEGFPAGSPQRQLAEQGVPDPSGRARGTTAAERPTALQAVEDFAESLAQEAERYTEDGETGDVTAEWVRDSFADWRDRQVLDAEPGLGADLGTRIEALFAGMCPLDPAEPHECPTLIAAHDAAQMIRRARGTT